MEGGVKLDRWGYYVRTSSDACIFAINSYYHQFLTHGRERSVIMEAPVHDADCVLGNILPAHFLSSTDPSRVPLYLDAAKSQLEHATSYEKAVFDAVSYLISSDRDDEAAVQLHSKLLKDFPKDLVSLKRGQLLCFYMGRPDLSLDLVEQVLPNNLQENYIYGMLAFALLELGRMEDAEKAARKGFEINNHDVWSQHNLCHVFQHNCRFDEAVKFMEECSSSWGSCSSFIYTHNWWHVAVCCLEGHSPIKKVLEIYDQYIWKELERSNAASPEVYLNALGLLLRVYVRGEMNVFEDRLRTLASQLLDQSSWYLEWHLDLLIIWALSSTGQTAKAEELLKGLKSRMCKMSKKKQEMMQKGMLLAEALYEYGRGNYEHTAVLLGPDFDANSCKMIGASDEQLDVFNEVWYVVLLEIGQVSKAIEVIEKRIKIREGVPFLWRLLDSLKALKEKEQRTVYRLTLVKGWNTEEIIAYSHLFNIGKPNFIEIKGVAYCGSSTTSKLTMENVPWHADVKAFSEALAMKSNGEYEVACEHVHSCCVLLAKTSKFKSNGQ